MPDLQAIGVELHGMEIDAGHLITAVLLAWWDQPADPGQPPPRYGPRPLGLIFTDDFESGDKTVWSAAVP